MALTIGLRRILGLYIFARPCSLGGREFMDFNVDVILLEMLLLSISEIHINSMVSYKKIRFSPAGYQILLQNDNSNSHYYIIFFKKI